jgi:integrase
MAALTDAAVRAAKAKGVARDISDGTVPGLCLRVLPSGRKGWTLRVRHQGRNIRVDVGDYPGTGLAEARDLARAARKLAERDENPEHAIRPPQALPGITVTGAIEKWLQTKAGNRSLSMERRRMQLHVESVIGAREIKAISRADLAALLHDMAFGPKPVPVEANRTFTSLRGLFAWVAAQDIRPDDPTALLRRPVKIEPSAERMREGTEPLLATDELAQLWRAAPGLKSAVLGDLLRMLLLIPLRREEINDLGWNEVRDTVVEGGWSGAALAIPAARMKGKRPATVPLSRQAQGLLAQRRKLTGGGEFVFAVTGREKPFAGWKRASQTLRDAMKNGKDWSPHTIRKSVATALVRDLGADELLVGRILQHSPRAILGVTDRYLRSNRLSEQSNLLQRWADHLEALAAKLDRASTVRSMRA